jgi:hypothetical protein
VPTWAWLGCRQSKRVNVKKRRKKSHKLAQHGVDPAMGHETWIESQRNILPSVDKKNGSRYMDEQMSVVGSPIANMKPKDYWCCP